MNCDRYWGNLPGRYIDSEGELSKGCNGCWNVILNHMVWSQGESILPRPDFCQDAAYIAFVIDGKIARIKELEERVADLYSQLDSIKLEYGI